MRPALFVTAAVGWCDDRLGAILVKEARQAVRSRFVVAVQFLFLAVLVAVLGMTLLRRDPGEMGRHAGRDIFVALNTLLHALCVVCVPLYVGVRLAFERNSSNVDLMFSTTLRPWSVVMGKMGAGLLVGLLAVSACAPFMVLCYFLRGMDVPSILFALALDLLFLWLATLLGVFVGAFPSGAAVKVILALAAVALACASVSKVGYELTRQMVGDGGFADLWRDPEGRVGLAVFGLCAAAVGGFLFMLSAAMIAPETANRALPVRAYMTGWWLLSALGVGLALRFPGVRAEGRGLICAWAVGWSVLLALAMLVASSERDATGPRLEKMLPAPRAWFRRGLSFLFFSGAAGGLAWSALLAALTLGAAWAGQWRLAQWVRAHHGYDPSSQVPSMLLALAIGVAMILGYALLAGVLRRALLGRFTRPVHTGGVAAALIAAGSVVPPLAVFMLHDGNHFKWEKVYVAHAFNPFAAWVYAMDSYASGEFVMVAMIGAVSAGFMCMVGLGASGPWLVRQARAFFFPPAAPVDAPVRSAI